jgi:hypothetical protein
MTVGDAQECLFCSLSAARPQDRAESLAQHLLLAIALEQYHEAVEIIELRR